MRGNQINFVQFVTGGLVIALMYIAINPLMDIMTGTIIPANFTMTATESLVLHMTLPVLVGIFAVWIISRFTKGRGQGG